MNLEKFALIFGGHLMFVTIHLHKKEEGLYAYFLRGEGSGVYLWV
jgi:hypothetical protein